MTHELITTATVVVLCAAAGVRAYLPLLALGIGAHFGVTPLTPGFGWLDQTPVLVGLALLATIEFLADKVPGIDHLNDAVHTVVRPLSGVLIMASSSNVISNNSLPAAVIAGLALAGTTHAIKAGSRPLVTATTAGIGNPVMSVIEDLGVSGLIVLAFVVPLVALVITVILLVLTGRSIGGLLGRRRRDAGRARPLRSP